MTTNRAATSIGPFAVIGMALAVMLSWGQNHSIGWAILHGLLDWFYVIYWFFKYS